MDVSAVRRGRRGCESFNRCRRCRAKSLEMSGPSRSVSVFIDAGAQVKECHVIRSRGQIFFSIARSRVIHPFFRRNPWLLRSVVSLSFETVGRLRWWEQVNRDRCLALFSTILYSTILIFWTGDVPRIGIERGRKKLHDDCVKSKIGPSLSSLWEKYLLSI